MIFNSYEYILLFLPITVMLYYLLNKIGKIWGKVFLLLASILFYSLFDIKMMIALCVGMAVNFLFVHLIRRKDIASGFLVVAPIVLNILVLFLCKYLNFSIRLINDVFRTDYELISVIVPVGISFIVFQEIAYLVAVKNREVEEINVLDYALFMLFFPKLIMGPLMEPKDFIYQINDDGFKKTDLDNIAGGIKIFCFGLFKKVIMADTFARAVDWGFNEFSGVHATDWILISIFYTLEIYFDFSGYSDMATGSALLFNITLPINFDSPYKAISVRDFWKRWHISLTSFFTKYIYIPLGGSRKGRIVTYANTMIVFLISGIWHGANYTFILWGILYGLFMVFERVFEKILLKIPKPIKWLVTFGIVDLLWLLFRSESVGQWLHIVTTIIKHEKIDISAPLMAIFWSNENAMVSRLLHIYRITDIPGMWMILYTVFAFAVCLIPKNNYRVLKKLSVLSMLMGALSLFWCLFCLGTESSFIYLNF